MPSTPIDRAETLKQEGQGFTYRNFADPGEYGYPNAYKADYVSWTTRLDIFLSFTFGKSSPIYETFLKGERITVLGNKEDKFARQVSTYLGALEAAIDELQFQPEDEAMTEAKADLSSNNKVFVVHGHDEILKTQMEIFLGEIGLEAIVLHRKADEGLTVIEKFEKHSDVGYAFILLTPDDIAYPVAEESKADSDRAKERRARQNVIFEFGYFVAKLSRGRVCCLYKDGVTVPTDVAGMIYKKVQSSVEEAAFSILKDLKAVGYKVST